MIEGTIRDDPAGKSALLQNSEFLEISHENALISAADQPAHCVQAVPAHHIRQRGIEFRPLRFREFFCDLRRILDNNIPDAASLRRAQLRKCRNDGPNGGTVLCIRLGGHFGRTASGSIILLRRAVPDMLPLRVGLLYDLVLERLQSVSSERVERSDRHENISGRLDLKICKSKVRVAGLSEPLFDLSGFHRALLRRLDDLARDFRPDAGAAVRLISRAYREPRRLSWDENRLAGDLSLWQILKIFLFDLREEAVIRSRITGLRDRQKIAPVPFIVVARAQVGPQVKRPQPPHVLRLDLPGRLPSRCIPFDVAVDIFPVQGGNTRRVVRALHSSLYFERVDSGVDQIREDLQDAHVPHGQGVSQIAVTPGCAAGALPS